MGALEVTVVIPTRNRLAMLAQCLHSALGQRDVDIEVVVVDEGSSDGSPDFLTRVAAADPRVRVLRHNPARGLPAARNAGVAVAAAPVVAFCDDDDLWSPEKLRVQLDAQRASGAGWSATSVVAVDEALTPVGVQHLTVDGDVRDRLLRSNVLAGGASSAMVDVELARRVGGFDEGLSSSEDWEMWIRLAGEGPLATVDRPLIAYRVTSNSMSTVVARMRESRKAILSAHGGTPTPADGYDYERFLARQLVRGGNRFSAAAAYARLAVKHRRPAQLVRAAYAVAALHRLDEVGTRRATGEIPPAWVDEVNAWLRPLAQVTPDRLLVALGERRGA